MDLIRIRMGTQFLKISKSRTGVKFRNYSKSVSNQKKPVGIPAGFLKFPPREWDLLLFHTNT